MNCLFWHFHILEPGKSPERKKSKPSPSNDFLDWSEISGISIGDDEQAHVSQDESQYKPSDTSIREADQEGIYFENEGEEDEEDGASLIQDVEDLPVNIKDGYVMIDISILNGLVTNCCQKCRGNIVQVDQFRTGAMLSYTMLCVKGHTSHVQTQKMSRRQPEGNVLLANAIFTSGISFTAWLRFSLALNILSFSTCTYYKLVGKYIKPAIVRTWTSARKTTLDSIKSAQDKLIAVADGQFDSMGFCAKYLIETLMCATTGKIVDFVILQKGLYTGEMEGKGLRYLLNRLKSTIGDKIGIVCTDRNTSVRKIMRTEFPEIDHQFDIWHLAKSLKKRIKLLFKGSSILLSWSKSITNHLWWCSQTCGGCDETLLYKWTSLCQHMMNDHSNCEHELLSDEESKRKAWVLDPSDVKKLRSLVTDKRLLKDLQNCTQYVHTGSLESVHSKANIYRPKKFHFSYQGMVLRTCLAYIDHNSNLNKKVVNEVSEFSKETGQWMARKVYEKNNYQWLKDLAAVVLKNVQNPYINISDDEEKLMFPFTLPKNIAPVPKISIEQLPSVSRFSENM
jgi:hypothetical protein